MVYLDRAEFDKLVELAETGLADENELTRLEPYRAKRAIFLAAGMGTRLRPITVNTPKPLVRVNEKRIIETMIDACLEIGISEIYIVRGYLADEFDILLKKYPMIKFIDNLEYDVANNILSAVKSCHLFENAYVLEADLLVTNPKILKKYHYDSEVLGIWKSYSDDWCMTSDHEGYVLSEFVGGKNCYQMVGIYYWNKQDAKMLKIDLNEVYYRMPGGHDMYWETVPNQIYQGKYKIKIVSCQQDDVVEIDTFDELRQIDKSYL